MQLYTREELLKRAWIADSVQADIMIEAIAASYNGDFNTFDCLINKVANLHWLSERIKCVDPSIGETTEVVSTREILQVSSLALGTFEVNRYYTFTVIQPDGIGDLFYAGPTYTSNSEDTIETVVIGLIESLATLTTGVTASIGEQPDEIIITATAGNPLFILETGGPYQTYTVITEGLSSTKSNSSVEYSGRCLTDEQIKAIVLNIELLAGSPCGCDPNIFLTDTIPNIITFTSPVFASVIPFSGNTGTGTGTRDFNTPDFNNIDFR
jgi:hypothetical protein